MTVCDFRGRRLPRSHQTQARASATGSRRLGVAILGVGLMALLSGCSPEPDIYARMSALGLEFLVCDLAGEATGIEVLSGEAIASMESVWVAAGPELKMPAEIRYGEPPETWTTDAGPLPIAKGDQRVQIYFSWSQSNKAAAFDLGALESSRWMAQDGRFLSDGCEDR